MVAVASHQQKCCQNQGLISEALDSGPCSSPRRGWVSSTGPPAHKWLVIKASWWQGRKTLKVYRLASAWAPTLSPHLSIFTTFEQGVIIYSILLFGGWMCWLSDSTGIPNNQTSGHPKVLFDFKSGWVSDFLNATGKKTLRTLLQPRRDTCVQDKLSSTSMYGSKT